ncbi:hypothetical protein A2482_02605 [Candidatus Falkowbacteria bacterium RIFOXYC2_FULL_48_21]|uniref:Uncharacterized protein n=1 Tax=Candidatus Falkowbacteria bacterium RIFOXYC2_FULL_48_21 TaxID=1798005 RepID=A0A1F5TDQ0_9BACT|nr:MAG: hypothetical protein A2482_02605 [Candidatus Falkowbacteria bacterium RIFOXYC2_FULL_48_21]
MVLEMFPQNCAQPYAKPRNHKLQITKKRPDNGAFLFFFTVAEKFDTIYLRKILGKWYVA